MRAYKSERTDALAAEALGMPMTQFRSWRVARGIPGKSKPGRPKKAVAA